MRRESPDDVAQAARRRLDELGRYRTPATDHVDRADERRPLLDEILTAPIPEPGRHARGRTGERAGWRDLALTASAELPRLGSAHVRVLALIGTAAVVLAAWAALRSGPQPVPVASTTHGTPVPQALPTGPTGTTSPSASPTGSPSGVATSGVVVVDVAGKVLRPGVATLPVGSRVIDALRRAGGASRGVDLSTLNLARLLVDGEQILVGMPARAAAAAGASGPTGGSGAGPSSSAPVNLNTATAEMLDALPGVGPVTAQKIVDWRTEHGSFSAVEELLEVDGIGPKTLAEIAPGVTL